MRLSIVIPFYNEEAVARQVLEEARRCQQDAEILAVDDGSTDRTWDIIRSVAGIRRLRLAQNRGQSAAIYAGLRAATGDICALMDGDGQNDPADIGPLVAVLERGEADVVCGFRQRRRDTAWRRFSSRVANAIRQFFLRDGIRDTGCSLKVFHRRALDALVPFNGLHRFLPALFRAAGLRLLERPVNHRPRLGGQSKYQTWDRAVRGVYDLVGVAWLLRRRVLLPTLETNDD